MERSAESSAVANAPTAPASGNRTGKWQFRAVIALVALPIVGLGSLLPDGLVDASYWASTVVSGAILAGAALLMSVGAAVQVRERLRPLARRVAASARAALPAIVIAIGILAGSPALLDFRAEAQTTAVTRDANGRLQGPVCDPDDPEREAKTAAGECLLPSQLIQDAITKGQPPENPGVFQQLYEWYSGAQKEATVNQIRWFIDEFLSECIACAFTTVFIQLIDANAKAAYVQLANGLIVLLPWAFTATVGWFFAQYMITLIDGKAFTRKVVVLSAGLFAASQLLGSSKALPWTHLYEVAVDSGVNVAAAIVSIATSTCSSIDPSLQLQKLDEYQYSPPLDIVSSLERDQASRLIDLGGIELLSQRTISHLACTMHNVQRMMTVGVMFGGYGIYQSNTNLITGWLDWIYGALLISLFAWVIFMMAWAFIDVFVSLLFSMAALPIGLMGFVFPPFLSIAAAVWKHLLSTFIYLLYVSLLYMSGGMIVCSIPRLIIQAKIDVQVDRFSLIDLYTALEAARYELSVFDMTMWGVVFVALSLIGAGRKANHVTSVLVGMAAEAGSSLGQQAQKSMMGAALVGANLAQAAATGGWSAVGGAAGVAQTFGLKKAIQNIKNPSG